MFHGRVPMSESAFSRLRPAQRGFTLVELLVTLSVLAILSALALPSMQNAMANQRLASGAYQLKNILDEARGEAARRRIPVQLWSAYPSTSDSPFNGLKNSTLVSPTADTVPTEISSQKPSWYLYAPDQTAATASKFPQYLSISDNVQITTSLTAAQGRAIRFVPYGPITQVDVSATSNGTPLPVVVFRVCDRKLSGEPGYTVVLNQNGIARVEKGPIAVPADTTSTGAQACA